MASKRELAEQVERLSEAVSESTELIERIESLELALEDVGWQKMSLDATMEFSRDGLRKIAELARLFYLKNPLIKRGVDVQAYYVFGQGIGVRAKADLVNEIIQAFLDDEKNKAELTSHEARMGKEAELQIEGNLFFVLFTDKLTGRVRVRTIPAAQVEDIITNPEDAKDPWYYKRTWTQGTFDAAGVHDFKQVTRYYPDWRHQPSTKPQTINYDEVAWSSPVYHVKTGGLPDMKFGVSEVYAALDWARAYKDFLTNWCTLMDAYARLAFKLTHKGGSAGVAAAKVKLSTAMSGSSSDTNPPPLTGSTFISTEGVDIQALRTSGATTSADEGRRLMLMVAAVLGLPESFFGDVQGTYATAKNLDRPTELKMVSRQTLWADIFRNILNYVVAEAVRAGKLPGTIEDEEDGTPRIELAPDPDSATGEPMDGSIDISFPPVLEHDVGASVAAITMAATLDGKAAAGTLPPETVSQLLCAALGLEDMDAILEKLFPSDEEAAEAATRIAKAAADLREAFSELAAT